MGHDRAIIILGRFYPATPLVNIRVCVPTGLPEINKSFLGNTECSRADPFFGVVYKLRVPIVLGIHRRTVRMRNTDDVLRIQHIFVRSNGLKAKDGCLPKQNF